MTKYIIAFPSDAMDYIPEEKMADVAKAAHACCQELIDAGVHVLAGGLEDQPSSIVATDGTVSDGPEPDVAAESRLWMCHRQEAPKWAAKIAAACRCAQEVREVGADPELEAMLRQAAGRPTADG